MSGRYGFNAGGFHGPNHLLSYPPWPQPSAPHPPGNRGYYWVHSNTFSGVPQTAVRGGTDADGSEIYVGRAFHEGDYIPAKIVPARREAYVAYDGGEHMKTDFEVLCEQRFEWVQGQGGYIPPNAVEGGRTSDGERLFIGRTHHNGSLTVGKVHPSHGCLYIPFGGQELRYDQYEILVLM